MVIDTTISRKTLKIGNLRPFLLYPGISAPESIGSSYTRRNHANIEKSFILLFKRLFYSMVLDTTRTIKMPVLAYIALF